MPLFEVAIIQKPTKKEADEGVPEKLVLPPKAVMAKDNQSAAVAAVTDTQIPKDTDMTRIEVLVRPFA